jgi:hypothetical protein
MIEAGPTVRLRAELQTYLAPLPTSIHDLHKYIRDNTGPDVVHCQLSDFMMAIADVVGDRAKRGDGHEMRWDKTKHFHDGYDVYGVTIADLGIIKDAILRFTRLSAVTSFGAFMNLHQLNRGEITMAEFPSLMRRAWLQEKRLIYCDKGLNGSGSRTQAPRVTVAVPVLTDSRRGEFEEVQDEVMSETESVVIERTIAASNRGGDSDPPTFPNGAESDLDDGDYNTGFGGSFDDHSDSPVAGEDHDMGEAPETPQNDDLRSELPEEENAVSESNLLPDISDGILDEPLLVEPLQSTPLRDSVNETDDRRYDPDHPLPTVESAAGSASLEPVAPRSKPLSLHPLNSYRNCPSVGTVGSQRGVVSWRKVRSLREDKDREANTNLLKTS